MADRKNQHYVPQFLLRHFASDTTRRHLCLFRIESRRHVRRASIRHQCSRDYFYGKDKKAETRLGLLETDAGDVIRDMVNGEDVPEPYTPEMRILLEFLMFQWSRTPVAAARQEEMMTLSARNFVKTHPELAPELAPHIDSVRMKLGDPVGLAMHTAARKAARKAANRFLAGNEAVLEMGPKGESPALRKVGSPQKSRLAATAAAWLPQQLGAACTRL